MASSSAGSGGAAKSAFSRSGRLSAFGCGPSMQTSDLIPGEWQRGAADRIEHVVGVDDDAGLVVGEIVFELVGEAHVDQGGDRADPPAGEQAEQIVHAVVGEDGDAVALAHAEMMQRAGKALHRADRLGEGQRLVAIDPAEGDAVRMPVGTIDEKLMHQHGPHSCVYEPAAPASSHNSE